jgi:hypothetical protein
MLDSMARHRDQSPEPGAARQRRLGDHLFTQNWTFILKTRSARAVSRADPG